MLKVLQFSDTSRQGRELVVVQAERLHVLEKFNTRQVRVSETADGNGCWPQWLWLSDNAGRAVRHPTAVCTTENECPQGSRGKSTISSVSKGPSRYTRQGSSIPSWRKTSQYARNLSIQFFPIFYQSG